MKIVIPVDEKMELSDVCVVFARTPYFGVYNTEDNSFDFIDNTATESSSGAGIKAAQLLVDEGVDVLLTPRCGENSEEVLKAAEIKIYKIAKEKKAMENIKLYIDGQLNELTEFHGGFHGRGAK